jgi:hypothetical protein
MPSGPFLTGAKDYESLIKKAVKLNIWVRQSSVCRISARGSISAGYRFLCYVFLLKKEMSKTEGESGKVSACVSE